MEVLMHSSGSPVDHLAHATLWPPKGRTAFLIYNSLPGWAHLLLRCKHQKHIDGSEIFIFSLDFP